MGSFWQWVHRSHRSPSAVGHAQTSDLRACCSHPASERLRKQLITALPQRFLDPDRFLQLEGKGQGIACNHSELNSHRGDCLVRSDRKTLPLLTKRTAMIFFFYLFYSPSFPSDWNQNSLLSAFIETHNQPPINTETTLHGVKGI